MKEYKFEYNGPLDIVGKQNIIAPNLEAAIEKLVIGEYEKIADWKYKGSVFTENSEPGHTKLMRLIVKK